jgi:hypothetical protein
MTLRLAKRKYRWKGLNERVEESIETTNAKGTER